MLAALIRLNGLDFHSGDYDGFLRPWYDEIKANGGLAAIGTQVGNYNVLYQVCIALMTCLPVHPLTAYKGLSVLFDYLLAGSAALVARELTGDRVRAALAEVVADKTFVVRCCPRCLWIRRTGRSAIPSTRAS